MSSIPNNEEWQDRAARFLEDNGWTVHEPGKSCIDGSDAFEGKQETSYKAAKDVYGRTGTMRRTVYDFLVTHGPHADAELFDALDLNPNSCRPRRVELVRYGVVRDSGARRIIDGEECILWEAVRHGEVSA